MLLSTISANLATNPENARENFPIIKKAGFDGVDFSFDPIYSTTPDVFDLPQNELREFFLKIKEEANKNGISVLQTHAIYPTQVVTAPKEENEKLFSVVKKNIELTALMGCKYVVIHPIFGRYDNALTPEEEKKVNMEFYTSLIPTLKQFGVVACLENMWVIRNGKIYGAVCADFCEAKDYIDQLNEIAGEELFGFCFDFGHATLCSADIVKSVKILGNRIKVLHLHEVDGVHDNHGMPFTGVCDWEKIFTALKEIGYKGNINFEAANAWETFPYEVREQALTLLGAIGKHFIEKYM
jgi:sugar phosphate isomerase/epimerase